ncbi:MAG: asparagine synthase (glutamine-hydrolyzing) [Bacteroidota bacterium]
MCGITGVFSFNTVGRIHLIHLEAATTALEKRGPDVHQTWFDETIGLGHRRLSILDTSAQSNQPFFDATERYALIYNGEVYNFQELKQRLQNQGVNFRTTSDTEVVLYAYIKWGPECVQEFNGFFSLAIYDRQERSLYLARDRFGIKPLLYTIDDDKLLFASEIKSLLAYNIERRIDLTSLYQYLELTYVPDQYCMLQGIKKLPAGSYGIVSEGELTVRQYYETAVTDQVQDLDSTKGKLIDLMRTSVRRRLISDVPLGAFLSGGIDSSIIVALASEMTSQLKTFSVGFEDNAYFDETHYAELVAKKFNTDHTVFRLKNADLLDHVEDIVSYFDEPFADSSAIPFYILSKLTRNQITVALSGDGADEVFSGYNKHQAWEMVKQGGLKNQLVGAGKPLWKLLPKSRYFKLTDLFRQLDKYATVLGLPTEDRYWQMAAFVPASRVALLLKNQPEALDSRRAALLNVLRSPELNDVLHTDMHLVLRGDMLRKADLMSMANGLEVRVPFLDHDLVDYAFTLGQDLKLQGNQRKIILREAFRDILPRELYSRPKHGFEVPVLNWFKKELKSDLEKYVFHEERVRSQGLFEWGEIKRIKRRLHSLDPGDVHIQVWSLYVFQKWYSRYMQA